MQSLSATISSDSNSSMAVLTTRMCPGRPPRLIVTGEIDLATAEQFEHAVAEAISGHHRLVIDLTGVEFLSSIGIGTLYAHLEDVAAVLVNDRDNVARTLAMVGFPRLVVAPPTVVEAGPAVQTLSASSTERR